MVDIDKFICSMIEHQMDGSIYRNQLLDSLNKQGIIYKDGSLIKIDSKKPEGKLKEMLDEKVLANSCESSKDYQPLLIEKDKWYMCIRSYNKALTKGKLYFSKRDCFLTDDYGCQITGIGGEHVRLATKEEIKGKGSQRIVSAKAKEEGYSKSEIDIDKMVEEYRSTLPVGDYQLYGDALAYAYSRGILDTLELIKKG